MVKTYAYIPSGTQAAPIFPPFYTHNCNFITINEYHLTMAIVHLLVVPPCNGALFSFGALAKRRTDQGRTKKLKPEKKGGLRLRWPKKSIISILPLF